MNCPECGVAVQKDANFCPKCFARIEPTGLLRRILNFFQNATKPGLHVIKTERTVKITTVDRDGNRHDYKSVGEVPLAQRAQFEKLEAEVKDGEAGLLSAQMLEAAKDTPGIVRKKSFVVYKVKDATGQERTYHSLEELPPNIREAIERIKGSGGLVS